MPPLTDSALMIGLAIASGLAVMLVGIALAYREGKRIGALTRSDRFDRLPSPLNLGETEWEVQYTEFGRGRRRQHQARLHFRQFDARVIGEGEDERGRRWSAEGVVFHDSLCYLFLEHGRGGVHLGAVLAARRAGEAAVEGMRCIWSQDRGAVTVQPIRLLPAARSCPSSSPRRSPVLVTSGNAR